MSALVVVALATCSGRDDVDERAPGLGVTTSQAEPAAKPTSEVSTAGQAAKSRVEVRVGEILSRLDATETAAGTVIRLPERVLFDFGKADLKPAASATLDELVEVVRFYASAPVRIHGHTDAVGSDERNQALSEQRAEAVLRYLRDRHGIDPSRLRSAGFGERMPVAPNANADGSDNPAGRELNRRVEILIEGARRPPDG